MISVTKTVTAQNMYTDSIAPHANDKSQRCGFLSLAIYGTWVATITVQRSFDAGQNWVDVTTYTTNQHLTIDDRVEGILYRVGCKTGNFTSGTCYLVLAK